MNETVNEVEQKHLEISITPKPEPKPLWEQLVAMRRKDRRFTYNMPKGVISDSGVSELANYLTNACVETVRFPRRDWYERIVSVGLDWCTKQGTWPKRFLKAMKKDPLFSGYLTHYNKNIGEIITQPILSEVGSILSRNASSGGTVWFDITSNFNWRAGDFGDDDSCFWGANKEAREVMEGARFMALRFWEGDEDTDGDYDTPGKARCWIGKDPRTKCPTLFNGYGMDLIIQTRILSDYLGVPYAKVDLTNNGEDCGLIYINGGRGYILGTLDTRAIDLTLEGTGTVQLL